MVATGTLRDDMYLHITPGRETDRFYLLACNLKAQMLVRASMPKNPPAAQAAKHPAPAAGGVKGAVPVRAEARETVPRCFRASLKRRRR